MTNNSQSLTLEEQREEYKKRRFLAMPIAGTIAWLAVGVCAFFLPQYVLVWVLFGATGMIVYMGMFISKFTGENFTDKNQPKNEFMDLFMQTLVMSLLVYAIAIPFFIQDHTSLPLTVGILTGLMWVPMTWSIQHWAPMAHGIARTVLVTIAWFALPEQRFTVIPFIIVVLYLWVIMVMEKRYKLANA